MQLSATQSISVVHRSGIDRRVSPPISEPVLIRLPEVIAMCGLSRSSIYKCAKDKTFPAPIKLAGKPSAWIKQEVQQWVNAQVSASRLADR